MADGYIGEIRMFAGSFAPKYWAFCDGQILAIQSNTALFSLIGTSYGGNGTTTFALPDLRGRAPVHQGQGPSLGSYTIGEHAGAETVTLSTPQIPQHSHALQVAGTGNQVSPQNSNLAMTPARDFRYSTSAANASMGMGLAGGSQAHENRSPYLALNFIICTLGIFPSRN